MTQPVTKPTSKSSVPARKKSSKKVESATAPEVQTTTDAPKTDVKANVEQIAERVKPIMEGQVKEFGFVNNRWTVSVHPRTPTEHVWKPEYYALSARKIRPGDELVILYKDHSYLAHAFVNRVTSVGVHLVKLFEEHLEVVEGPGAMLDLGEYTVKWHGTDDKYVVIRKSDNKVVARHFPSQSRAVQRAEELAKI